MLYIGCVINGLTRLAKIESNRFNELSTLNFNPIHLIDLLYRSACLGPEPV